MIPVQVCPDRLYFSEEIPQLLLLWIGGGLSLLFHWGFTSEWRRTLHSTYLIDGEEQAPGVDVWYDDLVVSNITPVN